MRARHGVQAGGCRVAPGISPRAGQVLSIARARPRHACAAAAARAERRVAPSKRSGGSAACRRRSRGRPTSGSGRGSRASRPRSSRPPSRRGGRARDRDARHRSPAPARATTRDFSRRLRTRSRATWRDTSSGRLEGVDVTRSSRTVARCSRRRSRCRPRRCATRSRSSIPRPTSARSRRWCAEPAAGARARRRALGLHPEGALHRRRALDRRALAQAPRPRRVGAPLPRRLRPASVHDAEAWLGGAGLGPVFEKLGSSWRASRTSADASSTT